MATFSGSLFLVFTFAVLGAWSEVEAACNVAALKETNQKIEALWNNAKACDKSKNVLRTALVLATNIKFLTEPGTKDAHFELAKKTLLDAINDEKFLGVVKVDATIKATMTSIVNEVVTCARKNAADLCQMENLEKLGDCFKPVAAKTASLGPWGESQCEAIVTQFTGENFDKNVAPKLQAFIDQL